MSPGYYTVNSWQITEWLINYEGGFVRRGLPGEIILGLRAQGINPYLIIMGLSFGIWTILFLLFLKLSSRRGFPAVVICSLLCMLFPAIGHQIVRKDCLIILSFVLSLYFFQKRGLQAFLVTGIISGITILSHEVYGFVSIPMLFLSKLANQGGSAVQHSGSVSEPYLLRRLVYTTIGLSPLLILFAICLIFKGNPSISQHVWDSWQNSLQFFPGDHSDLNPDDPPGAIWALGWSIERAMVGPLIVVREFSFGIYAPLAWATTIALMAFYLLLFYRSHMETLQTGNAEMTERLLCLSRILFVQMVAIFPLFVISWDYGRLIFYWMTSSIGAFLVLNRASERAVSSFIHRAISFLPGKARRVIGLVNDIYTGALAFAFASSRRVTLAKLSILLVGVPVCCWNVDQFVAYSPLVQPFYFIVPSCPDSEGPHRIRCAWEHIFGVGIEGARIEEAPAGLLFSLLGFRGRLVCTQFDRTGPPLPIGWPRLDKASDRAWEHVTAESGQHLWGAAPANDDSAAIRSGMSEQPGVGRAPGPGGDHGASPLARSD
jgi:hypothetical protein